MTILLVDSYDSFTYNLKSLLTKATKTSVITIHNDSYSINDKEELLNLNKLIDSVSAIVIGPGPGSPSNPDDIGIIPHIFEYCSNKPILGICLGFQVLCLQNGWEMNYLKDPVHGQIHDISVVNFDDLFKGFPKKFGSVRYHSICIEQQNGHLEPLAYYSDNENDKILMAVRHKLKPHFGVQYHPESISSTWGEELVKNFWDMCQTESLNSSNEHYAQIKNAIKSVPYIDQFELNPQFDYQFQKVDLKINILDLCDQLHSMGQDTLLLNSAFTPGEWTIVGLPENSVSTIITHSTESANEVLISKWNSDESAKSEEISDLYQFVANFMSKRYYKPLIDNDELIKCPFVGGLIGYFSYEEGQHIKLNNLKKITKGNVDDTKLCFIERFIAINQKHQGFIVSIKANDTPFLKKLQNEINKDYQVKPLGKLDLSKVKICGPDKAQYFKAFEKCQKYLHSGDSYELCLTCPTTLHFPKNQNIDSWNLYKHLVTKNPSPYSAFLDFGSSKLLSTSPERFISWNDEFCQMRPIKGTLRKTPTMTLKEAESKLKIPKEMGENLMIVDLIRHDIAELLGDSTVKKLMTVEEYETLYQLVSVIEGYFNKQSKFKGIDVFSHCLPPGSMTGAPKKRSVELLHELENNLRRGLYSGVCGYWSVNDVADWSVIIRSLFQYKDDLSANENEEVYRCGAGGAITVLSTAEGEWEEMHVKFDSVLKLFQ
ncbi:4-amino-4-deoxychorismate synthase [Martiniozyma asiatica (nom. inval.)]|nr:4-amino-4-deoxychorismate synthase [Martiniozyma asiatica]